MAKKENILLRFVLIVIAVLVFTFFDWIVHSSSAYLAVPGYYFKHKIIYGTLWACIASLVFRKVEIKKQAFLITAITVGLLQLNYIYLGFPLLFHLIIVTEHFFFMYLATYFALKMLKKLNTA